LIIPSLTNCFKGEHQATQWVDLEKHRRKHWTVPVHDKSAIICLQGDPDASLHEVEGDNIYDTRRSEQEVESSVEVEEPLQPSPVIEGECIRNIETM
jgi:hypothetical protein